MLQVQYLNISCAISQLLRSIATPSVDNQFAIANFNRSAAVGGAVFAKIVSQRAGLIFPIENIRGYRLVVDGNAAQGRILEGLRAVAFNYDVAIQIIAAMPDEFAQGYAGLNVQPIALDRDECLAASVSVFRDQIVQVICGEFYMRSLIANISKIFPLPFCH